MGERARITKETVARLAEAAGLPLTEDRLELLAPQLDDLVAAANELNRKMAERWETTPTVQFRHTEHGEERS